MNQSLWLYSCKTFLGLGYTSDDLNGEHKKRVLAGKNKVLNYLYYMHTHKHKYLCNKSKSFLISKPAFDTKIIIPINCRNS